MNIYKDGLDNNDSSQLHELITQDLAFRHLTRRRTRDQHTTLDRTVAGRDPTHINNNQALYANHEAPVGWHNVANGIATVGLRKLGDKFSYCNCIRERTED